MNHKHLLHLILIVIMFFSVLNYANAETINLPKMPTQADSEIVIPYGEDATASLPLFSKTYIRIHEGSKLNFNIQDPDSNVVLIRNSIIIDKIKKNGATVQLSIDGGPYEEMDLVLGEDVQLNYTYKFMPYMYIKQLINHYDNNPEKRSIVIYFNVLFLKTGQNFEKPPATGFLAINPSIIQPSQQTEKKSDPVVFLMAAVILLLLVLLIYYNRNKFKKLKFR